jgi:hypothetical protein
MILYISVGLLTILVCSMDLFRINNQIKIVFFFILYILIALFAGLRDDTGSDWVTYEEIYFALLNSTKVDHLIEPGYLGLNKAFIAFGWSFNALVFFVAFVSLGLKFYASTRSAPLFFIPILFYLSYYLIEYEMSGIRQSLAMGFAFCSLIYVKERRLLPFMLCILGGAFIHISIVAFIPIYFLDRVQFKPGTYIIFVLLGMIFAYYNISNVVLGLLNLIPFGEFITAKVISYSSGKAVGFTVGHIAYISFAILFLYYKRIINDPFYNILLNAYFIGLFLSFIFSGSIDALNRLTYYYLMVGGVLFSYIISGTQYLFNKVVLYSLLAAFIIVKIVDSITDPGGSRYYVPYKTFISAEK